MNWIRSALHSSSDHAMISSRDHAPNSLTHASNSSRVSSVIHRVLPASATALAQVILPALSPSSARLAENSCVSAVRTKSVMSISMSCRVDRVGNAARVACAGPDGERVTVSLAHFTSPFQSRTTTAPITATAEATAITTAITAATAPTPAAMRAVVTIAEVNMVSFL